MKTKGLQVKFFWNDKSTNCIALTETKQSNYIEVAEDSTAFKQDREPEFNWWVQKFINKRD